jgi:hypothetical protein
MKQNKTRYFEADYSDNRNQRIVNEFSGNEDERHPIKHFKTKDESDDLANILLSTLTLSAFTGIIEPSCKKNLKTDFRFGELVNGRSLFDNFVGKLWEDKYICGIK